MGTTTKKWLVRGGFGVLVAAAMALASPSEAAAVIECSGGDEFLGSCPPYTNTTCEYDCWLMFGNHGSTCIPNQANGCCVCLL